MGSVLLIKSLKNEERNPILLGIFVIICNIIGCAGLIVGFYNLSTTPSLYDFIVDSSFQLTGLVYILYYFFNIAIITYLVYYTVFTSLSAFRIMDEQRRGVISLTIAIGTGVLTYLSIPETTFFVEFPTIFLVTFNIYGQITAGLAIADKISFKNIIEASGRVPDIINTAWGIVGFVAGALNITISSVVIFSWKKLAESPVFSTILKIVGIAVISFSAISLLFRLATVWQFLERSGWDPLGLNHNGLPLNEKENIRDKRIELARNSLLMIIIFIFGIGLFSFIFSREMYSNDFFFLLTSLNLLFWGLTYSGREFHNAIRKQNTSKTNIMLTKPRDKLH